MLVSYWYFERDKNKTLNFHMNNSFYRNECLALKCCPQLAPYLLTLKLNMP